MTLAYVPIVPPSSIAALEHSAVKVANLVASQASPRWSCAFHHAIDLLSYARGLRFTTRCLANYEPDEVERRVEAVLAERGIRRGMR